MRFHAILTYLRSSAGPRGEQIILQGRLSDGRSCGIAVTTFRPRFFLRSGDLRAAYGILDSAALSYRSDADSARQSMAGATLGRISFDDYPTMLRAHRTLKDRGFATYEGDFSSAQQFLIDSGIRLYFTFDCPGESGDRVDIRAVDPEILPADEGTGTFPLRILALDIETTRSGEIRSISLTLRDSDRGRLSARAGDALAGTVAGHLDTVLSLDRGLEEGRGNDFIIRQFGTEGAMLEAFGGELRAADPDIITGWNVVSFDMAVILRRMQQLGVRTDFGRSREAAEFVAGSGDMPDHCEVPGRTVIDAMRLQRMHPRHFESYSLESVATEILGRGKQEQFAGDSKMDALDELWENDPGRFLSYCLEDSRLVLDILAETGLIALTVKRARLCGTTLGRAWASIHAFEQLYAAELHAAGIASPDRGVDQLAMNESPGGTIIFPRSGRFEYVLLLDFKGLYPSIIRSFGIDPLAHARARSILALGPGAAGTEGDPAGNGDDAIIRAPNDAPFMREGGVLPRLLTEFYELREDAKRNGDEIASFAYKILANSFYGVLGSPGCRFAGSDIATAITSFAREILLWSRDYAAGRGWEAIYGDTDSLFLIPPPEVTAGPDFPAAELFDLGEGLTGEINRALDSWVRERYRCESHLEIEFEDLFAPLFIPPLKSVSSDAITSSLLQAGLEGPQGRAKSYAGLAYHRETMASGAYRLVIKGMEAVRSDWTRFARNAQRRIIEAVLSGAGEEETRTILEEIIGSIKAGRNREDLVISKRLSKPAGEYKGNLPPHVRAAAEAERTRGGKRPLRRIRYIMSADGPKPVMHPGELASCEPDLNWYMEKQLIPVLQSINAAVPWDLEALCTSIHPPDGQGELW
jgi:DNA polymerase-2